MLSLGLSLQMENYNLLTTQQEEGYLSFTSLSPRIIHEDVKNSQDLHKNF